MLFFKFWKGLGNIIEEGGEWLELDNKECYGMLFFRMSDCYIINI